MVTSKELLTYTKNLSLLFVEDHDELRDNTTEILKNFFLTVDSASNGEEAFDIYLETLRNKGRYDLVITDIAMPKMDGVLLIEEIYKLNRDQDVIVLSAYDDANYLLPLINLGIEQFIKKPIDYQELLKTLLNIVKRMEKEKLNRAETPLIYFDTEYSFHKWTKILHQNDKSIYLTKYEIIFLDLLTDNLGKIYSNEEIVSHFASKEESIDSQNIRKLVSKLRKKIPEESLESIYGVGYRSVPFHT